MSKAIQATLLMFSLANRTIWRNWKRSLITLLSITLAVWSMVVFGSVMSGWLQSSLDDTLKNMLGHIQIHHPKYLDDPSIENSFEWKPEYATILNQQANISNWSVRLKLRAIFQTERDAVPVTLVGVDINKENKLSFLGTVNYQGKALSNANHQVFVGKALTKQTQTRLNKRIVLMSQNLNGTLSDQGEKIIGVYTATLPEQEKNYVFTPLKNAQKLVGVKQLISEIVIETKNLKLVNETTQALKKDFKNLDVQSWDSLNPFAKAMIKMNDGILDIWIWIMFVLVAFGLINTLLMSVFERTREIGLLMALGLKPRQIKYQILIESFILLIIGIVVGAFLGVLTLIPLQDGIDLSSFAQGIALFGMGKTLYLQINPDEIQKIMTTILLAGLVVSYYPAAKAAKMNPIKALNVPD